MLTPAFHFGILQGFVEVFVEQGEHLVNRLKAKGDLVIEDIVPLLTECTLNSICREDKFIIMIYLLLIHINSAHSLLLL